MHCWRICRRRYAHAAATGEGARLVGGRWNSRGISMVYASTSLALAAIETFVHLEPNLGPPDLVSITGEIPEGVGIRRLDASELPPDWDKSADETLRKFGDQWIQANDAVAMLVPSAAVRGEWNVLLNPAHADFAKIRFEPPQPFVFDSRLFRDQK